MSRTFIHSSAGTVVEYPNATHFAFVPAIFKITKIPTTYDKLEMVLTDRQAQQSYSEEREPFNGAAYFDVRRYLQLLFNNVAQGVIDYSKAFVDSPLKKNIYATIYWYRNGSQFYLGTFGIDAIWGTISARESSGGIMRRKWFVRYPFTVDVFAKNGTSFDVLIDGKQSDIMFYNHNEDAEGATPYHRYLLNPARVIDPSTVARSVHIAVPHSLVLKNDEEAVGMVGYTLDIDRSANGVYLRWIDQQGRYCYYLFKEIGSASTVSTSSTWERNDMNVPTAYIDGVNIETLVRQSLSRKKTRSLGAKLVDSETYDFLLTLAQSVVVDVFDGYDANDAPLWHHVNIVAGSYEKTTKHYQDFIFSIEEPALSAQML